MKKGKDFRMPAIACALLIVMCIGFVISYGLLGNSILGNLHTAQADRGSGNGYGGRSRGDADSRGGKNCFRYRGGDCG